MLKSVFANLDFDIRHFIGNWQLDIGNFMFDYPVQ